MNLTIENLELWVVALVAIAGIVYGGYKKWLIMKANGLTLAEVLDAVEEAVDKAEEVKEVLEEVLEETKE
jgi:PII-like signaling protein